MKTGDLETVVLTTRTRWAELPRLRHQVARQLARWYRVVFVETATTPRERHGTTLEEVEPGILRCRLTSRQIPPARLRRNVRWLAEWSERMEAKEIGRVMRQLDIEPSRAILFNFNHHATVLMERGGFALSTYVCNDDWVAKAKGARAQWIAREQQSRVARAADLCLAVSYPLRDVLKVLNPRSLLFLPAHEFEVAEPESEEYWSPERKIRALFVGNLDRRLETEWLEHAARQPDLEVHVVGTVNIEPVREEGLRNAGVQMHAPRFGDDLQEMMRAMDVFIIPYVLHDDVLAVTASNKLFKYVAAARPVVISAMPHFIDLGPGVIYRASSRESFVDELRSAVRQDSPAARAHRRRLARTHTWERRGEWLRALLVDSEIQCRSYCPEEIHER